MNKAADRLTEKQNGRTAVSLFFLFLCIYFLNASGQSYSADGIVMVKTAESAVKGRGFALEPGLGESLTNVITPLALKSKNGRYYAKYSPLPSALLIPFAAVGMQLQRLAPAGAPSDFTVFFMTGFYNSFVTALTVAALFFLCIGFGLSRRTAALTAVLFGAATMALPYAKMTFSEPLAGLMTTACFAWLVLYKRKDASAVALWIAAAAAALLPLARLPAVIAAAPFALYALYGRDKFKCFFAVAAGTATGLLIHGLFNYLRFGSFIEAGYSAEPGGFSAAFIAGLYGLLFSSDKSVFVYTPLLLLAPLGMWIGWRRGMFAEAACAKGVFILSVIFYATWHNWGGGHSWGPRFLLSVIPICMAAAGWFIASAKGRPALIAAVAVLAAASLTVQFAATFTKFIPHYENMTVQHQIDDMYREGRLFSPGTPRFLPMRAQFGSAAEHLSYSVRNAGKYLAAPGGSYEDLLNSKTIENAPDFWFSHVWLSGGAKLRAAAALAALAVLAAGAAAFMSLLASLRSGGRAV